MENPDLVAMITPEQFKLLMSVLYTILVLVYLGFFILVYWLYATKTELAPNTAFDLCAIIWFALVWPISIFFLPFAMYDFKKESEKNKSSYQ